MSDTHMNTVVPGANVLVYIYDSRLAAAVNRPSPFVYDTTTDAYDFELPWEPLPITNLLGLPLLATYWKGHSWFAAIVNHCREDGHHIPTDEPAREPNLTIERLSTEVDVKSSLFGNPRIIANCEAMFVRDDGALLTTETFDTIENFIECNAGILREVCTSGADDVSKKLRVETAISPTKFVIFFKQFRKVRLSRFGAEADHEKSKRWLDAECPIELDRHICELCGRDRTPAGTPLLDCSGCWKVKYCSRDCQVRDRPLHRWPCIRVPRMLADAGIN